MENNINVFKAAVSAALGAMTVLWGWFGWLVIAWIACMGIDYLTGSAVALKRGKWKSETAREGLWHKLGELVAVLCAGILDLVIGTILTEMSALELPFTYTVLLCPLVLVWYILTEAGSIIENAGNLGAPIPGWLARAVEELRDKVDKKEG